MTSKDKALMSDDAAQLLKVSKKTLLRHARAGKIPGTKLGRMWRFCRTELLDLLTTTTPETL